MRKKVITVVLLVGALEVVWLLGGLDLLRGKSVTGPVGRLKQEVDQVKSLIEKASEALKADPASVGRAPMAGASPSSGDPLRDPFALPQGVRLLTQPSGSADPKAPGEAGASPEKELAKAVPPEPPARELSGILVGPHDRVAIIDGTLVRTGDRIEGDHVIAIRRDHVVLARDGQRRTLRLPPPFPESRPGTEQLELRPSAGLRPKRSNGAPTP